MRYRKDLRWGSGITRQEQHRGGQRGKDLRVEGQMGGQREAAIVRKRRRQRFQTVGGSIDWWVIRRNRHGLSEGRQDACSEDRGTDGWSNKLK